MNLNKLITQEDEFHLHKSLGVISLINYIYRYYLLFVYGNMFLNERFDLMLIVLHACLSLSSLIFHIPSLRNRKSPMIYPEFRLHSIVFALRSVLCCFIEYYKLESSLYLKMIVCMITLILADIITHYFATNKSATMRNMPFSETVTEETQKEITYLHSSKQVAATLFMLYNIETAFSPMFGIQMAAFLMTLVRKNIISTNTWHVIYSMSLFINAFCFWLFLTSPFDLFTLFITYNLFIKLRFTLNFNKYISWIITFICFNIMKTSNFEFINNFIISNQLNYLIINGTIFIFLQGQIRKILKIFC